MKMKIGFVLDDSLDKPDGVQQYVLTLGRWLGQQGHEVHYLVGETKRVDIPNIHSLTRNVNVRFNQNRLSIPLPARIAPIRRLLEQEEFDVLHVQMPYSPFLGAKTIKLAPKCTAIVGTFHIIPFSRFERMASRLLGMWVRKSLIKFDQVISVSLPAQQFCKQSFGLESVVLPNVVDVAKFSKSNHTSRHNKIVFLGRLVPRKGSLELLRALHRLPSKNWELIMAGDGPLRKKLQDYSHAAGLANNIKFAGFVSEEEKAQLLASAQIAVFPSLAGESFGIVLIEAMAAGAGVVVGGDNPGYRSVLRDWPECLVESRDPTSFADSLQKLLTNEKMRTRLHNEQQKAVGQYGVDNVGPKLIDIYTLVVAKRIKN